MRFKNLGKVFRVECAKIVLLLFVVFGVVVVVAATGKVFPLWTCIFHDSVFPYRSYSMKTRFSFVFMLKSDSLVSVCWNLWCMFFNIFLFPHRVFKIIYGSIFFQYSIVHWKIYFTFSIWPSYCAIYKVPYMYVFTYLFSFLWNYSLSF